MPSIVRKCCSASTSVGAISAPCRPASTARRSVASATTVLPEPTSPCSSRCIGVVRARSRSISAIARSCASVSVNGSTSRYRVEELAGRRQRLRDEPLALGRAARERELEDEELVEGEPPPSLLGLLG